MAQAADPESGTLTLESGPIEYSQGPNVGVNLTPTTAPMCVDLVLPCDSFALTVDLPAQTITTPGGVVIPFEVDEYKKHCLLNGLDEIGVTLQEAVAIKDFETRWKAAAPWYFPTETGAS